MPSPSRRAAGGTAISPGRWSSFRSPETGLERVPCWRPLPSERCLASLPAPASCSLRRHPPIVYVRNSSRHWLRGAAARDADAHAISSMVLLSELRLRAVRARMAEVVMGANAPEMLGRIRLQRHQRLAMSRVTRALRQHGG